MDNDTKPTRATAKTIGANIRRRRKQLRMTQALLSKRVRDAGTTLHGPTLSRYEAGERMPGALKLVAISEVLYCTIGDLLSVDWNPTPPHPGFSE